MRLPTRSALLAAAALVAAPLAPAYAAKGKPTAAAKAPKAPKAPKAAKAPKPPKPPKALPPPKYVAALTKALQDAGVTEKITFDKKKFRLLVGTAAIELAKPYKAHIKMLQPERDAQLAELVAIVKPPPPPEPEKAPEPPPPPPRPDTLAAAAPRLRPVVREKIFFDAAEAALKAKDASLTLPRKPVGDTLAAGLAIDGEADALVTSADLAKWSAGLDDALAKADENLAKDPAGLVAVDGTKVFRSTWDDEFAPARVRFPEMAKSLALEGEPVFLTPNTRTLLVAGSKDVAGLEKLAQLAAEASAAGTPVSSMPLTFADGKYKLFLPDAKSQPALFEKYKVLCLKSLERDYATQAQLLETSQKDAGIAPFGLLAGKSGKTFSVAAWKPGAEQLLPRTDYVKLLGPDGAVVAFASWDKVAKVAGAMLKPDAAFSPKRYRAVGFPSDDQVKSLGKVETDSL